MRLLAVNDADAATVTEWRATNLLINSNELTNVSWLKTNATATESAFTTAGGLVLDKLQEDAASGNHVAFQGFTLAAGYYALSVWAAAAERSVIKLSMYNVAAGQGVAVDVDLAAGAVTFANASTPQVVAVASGVSADDGGSPAAYRIFLVVNVLTPGAWRFRLLVGDGTSFSYAGTPGNGLYVGRMQFEPGAAATEGSLFSGAVPAVADGFSASLPATNVQLEGRSQVARTTGTNGRCGWQLEWPVATTINCAILYRHTISDSSVMRLQAFDGPGCTGNIVYDSGNEYGGAVAWSGYGWSGTARAPRYSVLWLPAPVAVRSLRLMVNDRNAPIGYWQAKRLLVGRYVEPSRQLSAGMELSWVDASTQQRTAIGSLRTDPGPLYRRLSAQLQLLPEADRAALLEAASGAGLSREVFISVFPGSGGTLERDHALLGKFTKLPQVSQLRPTYAQLPIEIEEV